MKERSLFGIILILAGVFLLLNINDLIDYSLGEIISNFWPVLFMLLGLYSIITNPASKIAGFILIIMGAILQLKVLDFLDYKLFWAIFLILLGLYIIFFSKLKLISTSGDSFSSLAIFSGADTKNISQSFKGGSAIAIFGGLDIDLRGANIGDKNEAMIDIFTAFGGIDVIVPKGWNVTVKGIPLFGGWSNKVKINYPDGPTLKVNCFVMFGGVGVKN